MHEVILHFTSGSEVKERLLGNCNAYVKWVNSGQEGPYGLKQIIFTPEILYQRGWKLYAIKLMVEDDLMRRYPDDLAKRHDIAESIHLDLKDGLYPDAAAAAWMTIDDTDMRLDDIYINQKINKDLHYGLILKAYETVLRVCEFISGKTYINELAYIFDDLAFNRCHKYAVEYVCEVLDLEKNYAETLVEKVSMKTKKQLAEHTC